MFRTRLSAATTAKRHKTDAPGGNGGADIILFKRIAAYAADLPAESILTEIRKQETEMSTPHKEVI